MTTPGDYTQQLYAYLQAWRQLLESAAALATAMPLPGVVPGLPAMPAPAAPPQFAAPADPTQQLFAHLQAWRQYLEQTVGAAGTAPGPVTPPEPTVTAQATASPRPTEPVAPADPGGSRTGAQSSSSSSVPPPQAPKAQPRFPKDPFGGQLPFGNAVRPDVDRQAAVVARGQQMARPPALEFGGQIVPLINRVDSGAAAVPTSSVAALFKGLADRTPGLE